MAPAFLITFRESLEAAVIVGILLAVLRTMGQSKRSIFIWSGAGVGIILSLIFAWVFKTFLGGFEGAAEEIYEGIMMLFAAGLITHLLFWMQKHSHQIKESLERKVTDILERKELWLLFFLACFSVLREGVETVIFLQAISLQSDSVFAFWAASVGCLAAIILAIAIFWSSKSISPKKFFQATSVFLVFVAAGLLAHAIVEFQGAGVLPTLIKPVFDLSGVLSESEGLGAILKALFGYDANPSLIALIAYGGFLFASFLLLFRNSQVQKKA